MHMYSLSLTRSLFLLQVIREMLTGLEPEGDGTKFLRAWTEENVREALQVSQHIRVKYREFKQ